MWFKNLTIYRLGSPLSGAPAWLAGATADWLNDALTPLAYVPGNTLEVQRHGWVPPRDGGELVHAAGGHFLIAHRAERKLLPPSVIGQFAKARAQEIEEQQGFKPGRKQMKEIREAVTDELLPRAFSIHRDTRIWIDPVAGLLVIDSPSAARCDDVMQLLNKSVDRLGARPVHTDLSPVSAMTSWLAADEAPAGFTVDEDTELRSTAQSKATVRLVRQALDAEDAQRHIASGKQCTRLALTWSDRVSFVLAENLAIKRVAALDVLKENTDTGATDEAERFDADFVLMTGELTRMLADVFDALGGEKVPT